MQSSQTSPFLCCIPSYNLNDNVGILEESELEKSWGIFHWQPGVYMLIKHKFWLFYQALLLCRQFSLHHVMILSASSLALGWVNCKLIRPLALLNELNLIDFIMREVGCFGVAHIFGESNWLLSQVILLYPIFWDSWDI